MKRKADHLRLIEQGRRKPPARSFGRTLRRTCFLLLLLLLLFAGDVFFRVEEVLLVGGGSLDPCVVAAAGGIERGMRILFLPEKETAEQIAAFYPSLRAVEVRRVLPSTVEISCEKRTAVAAIASPEGYWSIDAATVTFSPAEDPPADLPVVRGIDPAAIAAGRELSCLTRRRTLQEFFAAWSAAPAFELAGIDFSDPHNLVLHAADGSEIWLGDERFMEQKLLLVRESRPYLDAREAPRLDVRAGNRLVVAEDALIEKKEVTP